MEKKAEDLLLKEAINSSFIDKWLIFSLLDPEIVTNLRTAAVFGCSGNEALVVTRDDLVYSLGTNCSGCLGLGDAASCLDLRKVEELSKKGIVSLAYGSGPHVLAVTARGEVYSWGHNGYHQLGNGSTSTGFKPTLVNLNLSGKRVVAVACGSHHSVVLTEDGEIFSWGQNNCGQVGSGSTSNQPTPRKITAGIGSKRVLSIACGQISTMVVLETGELYGWGYNGNGQLGLGTNANQTNPCRVSGLQGVVIEKVACGYAHTLALSDEGALYAWGCNSYGQLGIGNKANQVTPVKVATNIGRIVEIATTHYSHISVALTQDSKIYMWGQCRAQSIPSPVETTFFSIHEVFAAFSTPAVTHKPMELAPSNLNRVLDSLSQAFDDTNTSDLKFNIEGRFVSVHKAILRVRCEHFRSMFQAHWEEGDRNEIEITQFSFPVYHAFLKYLYTDSVNVSPEDAIGLLDLANSYCEVDLKKKCEKVIKNGITVDNVPTLYEAAIRYEAQELEDYCFRFALVHLTAVVQTEAFHRLDEATLKNFVVKAAKHGAFKH